MAINTTTVECSTSPSLISPNIKQENRDNERAKFEKFAPTQQTAAAATSIAFSITNILSNNFGNNNNNNNQQKVISEKSKKNGFVFRPYDNNNDCGESSPKKLKLDQPRSDDEDSNGECSELNF